jgi:3',5'-cyclic-AMP phosphodiesterase
MPIHLPPTSTRRDWLKQFAGTGLGLMAAHPLSAAGSGGGETWILFSDTHIAENLALEARGVCMSENLKRCVAQALKEKEKPFGVMVNGDLSFLDGQAGDYSALVDLMQPLRDAGLPVHLTLGNHDNRGTFMANCTSLDLSLMEEKKPVAQKQVSVVSSARIHWVLLDSLDKVNATPGLLGEAQLGWIDRTLAGLTDKPTVVMVHHNPQGPVPEGKKRTGLEDGDALLSVLESHKKVKALMYGHTHNWEVKNGDKTGIHQINLPPIAYVFNKERPSGWVRATVKDDGMDLELRSLNPAHPEHGQKVSLAWG